MAKSKDGIFILLVIFILVGLAWDPIKKGALKGNTSIAGSNSGSSSLSSQSLNEKDISDQIKQTEQTAKELGVKLQTEANKKKQSEYYGRINISYISYLNDPNPSKEYITLYSNLNKGEKVNITGWKIQSERTLNWVLIGNASTLPFPFGAANENVVIQQGDIVYLIKGFSPIGISFRNNKCAGYFTENRTFYPYLNRSCPLPRDEKLPKFSDNLDREDECLNLIDTIPACTTPANYTDFRKLPDTVLRSCKNYLNTQVNYNTCVSNHFGDTDFPKNEWYVYMNIFGPLWRDKREKINLYDNKGLIVSTISY